MESLHSIKAAFLTGAYKYSKNYSVVKTTTYISKRAALSRRGYHIAMKIHAWMQTAQRVCGTFKDHNRNPKVFMPVSRNHPSIHCRQLKTAGPIPQQ